MFSDIGSDQFISKYVHHEIVVVANIASAMMKLRASKDELESMKMELAALREEERAHLVEIELEKTYNRMSTGSKSCRLCMYCSKHKYFCCYYNYSIIVVILFISISIGIIFIFFILLTRNNNSNNNA